MGESVLKLHMKSGQHVGSIAAHNKTTRTVASMKSYFKPVETNNEETVQPESIPVPPQHPKPSGSLELFVSKFILGWYRRKLSYVMEKSWNFGFNSLYEP